MRSIRDSRVLRGWLLLALVASLSACHKWVPMTGPIDQAITYGRPDQIRVNYIDGIRVKMKSPWIEGDSVMGLDLYYDPNLKTRDTLTAALADVIGIDERKSDGLATAGLVVGIVFVAGAVGRATCPNGGLISMDPC